MKIGRKNSAWLGAVLLAASVAATAAAPDAVGLQIGQVKGPLFTFAADGEQGVFLVGSDAIAVVDPLSEKTALALKQQLQQRFSRPVRYVIFTSDTPGRLAGGHVFADTATLIGSQGVGERLDQEKVTAGRPVVTFGDEMELRLSARSPDILSREASDIVLKAVGNTVARGAAAVVFPKIDAVFLGEMLPICALPRTDLARADVDGWISALTALDEDDYSTVVSGMPSGPAGVRCDKPIHAFNGYLNALRQQVLDATRQGKSVADIEKSVKLADYAEWSGYREYRARNIAGMHEYVGRAYRSFGAHADEGAVK